MFGYIQIDENKLSAEQIHTYHMYRCGLCRVLRSEYGLRGQVFLNTDMTFLALLLSGLYALPGQKDTFLCQIHPGRKCMSVRNEATRYAAAMNLLISYYNLRDNWQDDRSYTSRMMAGMLRRRIHEVMLDYPRQAKALSEYMRKTAIYEASKEKNLDVIAGLTGDLMAEIFVWKEDELKDELRNLGFYLGKHAYLMDAYEDIEKDWKNKRFNPFFEMAAESREDFETFCRLLLNSQLSECIRSVERLPAHEYDPLIRNMLYYGVWLKYDRIHAKHLKSIEKDIKKQVKIEKKIDRLENKQNRLKKQKKQLEHQTISTDDLIFEEENGRRRAGGIRLKKKNES